MIDRLYEAFRSERESLPANICIDRNLLLAKAALEYKFAPRKFQLDEVSQLLKEEYGYRN